MKSIFVYFLAFGDFGIPKEYILQVFMLKILIARTKQGVATVY